MTMMSTAHYELCVVKSSHFATCRPQGPTDTELNKTCWTKKKHEQRGLL